jgi:hypothetical protein
MIVIKCPICKVEQAFLEKYTEDQIRLFINAHATTHSINQIIEFIEDNLAEQFLNEKERIREELSRLKEFKEE